MPFYNQELLTKKLSLYGFLLILLGAGFYGYETLLRISLGPVGSILREHFGLSAATFSLFGTVFFYAYAPMQILVGILVDKFNIKVIAVLSILICALGTLLISVSNNFEWALIGRFLQGFGAAFGYVTALKIATLAFPTRLFGLAVGFIASVGFICGGLGSMMISTLQIQTSISWSFIFQGIFVLGVFLSFLFLVTLKIDAKNLKKESFWKILLKGVIDAADTLKSIKIWALALFAAFTFLPTTMFADLWGDTYLQIVSNYNASEAVFAVSMIFYGWAVGSVVIGWVSDFFDNKIRLMRVNISIAVVISIIVLYIPLPYLLVCILFFAFGVLSASQTICYITVAKIIPSKKKQGTAMGCINMITSFIGLFLTQVLGFLLEFMQSGKISDNIVINDAQHYQLGMMIVPISLGIGVVLSFLIKE